MSSSLSLPCLPNRSPPDASYFLRRSCTSQHRPHRSVSVATPVLGGRLCHPLSPICSRFVGLRPSHPHRTHVPDPWVKPFWTVRAIRKGNGDGGRNGIERSSNRVRRAFLHPGCHSSGFETRHGRTHARSHTCDAHRLLGRRASQEGWFVQETKQTSGGTRRTFVQWIRRRRDACSTERRNGRFPRRTGGKDRARPIQGKNGVDGGGSRVLG